MSPELREPFDDVVELESLESPGIFESALRQKHSLYGPARDEKVQDPEHKHLLDEVAVNDSGRPIPFPLWRNPPANSLALAADMEQHRGFQITAFLAVGDSVDIPIVDDAGFPTMNPALPPLTVLRVHEETTAYDRVNNPATTNTKWYDWLTNLMTRNEEIPSYRMSKLVIPRYEWLYKDKPRAHRVLRLKVEYFDQDYTGTVTHVNFLVHVLGEGGGIPGKPGTSGIPNRGYEVGSSGTSKHHRIWDIFTPAHDHLSTPDQTMLRKKAWGNGETYLQATFNRVVYLNEPNGQAGDTSVFASPGYVLPAVLAFGDRDTQQNRGNVQTSWLCATWGRGHRWTGISVPPVHNAVNQRSFYTELYWDGADWCLNVVNDGGTVGQHDRNFYLFAWGPRA